jgi:hypothetical protein
MSSYSQISVDIDRSNSELDNDVSHSQRQLSGLISGNTSPCEFSEIALVRNAVRTLRDHPRILSIHVCTVALSEVKEPDVYLQSSGAPNELCEAPGFVLAFVESIRSEGIPPNGTDEALLVLAEICAQKYPILLHGLS